MPYYGEVYDNKSWDGKNWINLPDSDSDTLKQKFRIQDNFRLIDEKNIHPDGCFKCPMCWHKHYLITNYNLLCDGCLSVCANAGSSELRKNILEYKYYEKLYFTNKLDKSHPIYLEILLRKEFRDLYESKLRENYISTKRNEQYYLL